MILTWTFSFEEEVEALTSKGDFDRIMQKEVDELRKSLEDCESSRQQLDSTLAKQKVEFETLRQTLEKLENEKEDMSRANSKLGRENTALKQSVDEGQGATEKLVAEVEELKALAEAEHVPPL